MSTKTALILAGLLALALTADGAVNNGNATLFMLRKLSALIEHLIFWR